MHLFLHTVPKIATKLRSSALGGLSGTSYGPIDLSNRSGGLNGVVKLSKFSYLDQLYAESTPTEFGSQRGTGHQRRSGPWCLKGHYINPAHTDQTIPEAFCIDDQTSDN
ncbi:hypothetical protein B0H14DRAFT_2643449 [Mycena olivaceomarginata]|nr:hypothetical protein B0H14DRAFT_2643449 [Mycena olivaceomarginata]